ncbi:MAG: GerMN domain-containing protein [Armatimonadetes bacterium]|nr:GerMN domain-containing protein [Armatimonadota bacterium]
MTRPRVASSRTMFRWSIVGLIALLVALALWSSRPVTTPALIYFTQWGAGNRSATLQPVFRMVRGRGREEFVRQAIDELLLGPNTEEKAQGFVTEIPTGTRCLGVRIVGTMSHVDLSSEFEKGGGSASMLARLYQVVYTATHFAGVEEVRILINGNIRESMGGEGVMINVPVRRLPVPPRF